MMYLNDRADSSLLIKREKKQLPSQTATSLEMNGRGDLKGMHALYLMDPNTGDVEKRYMGKVDVSSRHLGAIDF